MEHSYLRYECADAFGLSVATPSSGHGGDAVVSCVDGDGVVWSAAGSRCVGTRPSRDGNPSRPLRRLGHVDDESPVGTGRALNASECACLDAHGHRVATGWNDGAVRVFDARAGEDDGAVVSTLLEGREGSDDRRVPDPPLVLNGHSNSPVTCVSFDRGDRRSPPRRRRDDDDDHDNNEPAGGDGGGARLASGGADGSVVVWDVVAETGLFRLLGHDRTVSALHFFAPSLSSSSSSSVSRGRLDGLASASLDGRLKVWDLEEQCCVQTVAGHRGEVWTADCGVFEGRRATPRRDEDDDDDDDGDREDERRWRMVTGASDNQLRVYAIRPPDRLRTKATAGDDEDAVGEESAATATTDLVTTTAVAAATSQPDDALFYVGSLARQTNERASLVRLCPAASLMGVAAHQSRNVEIYSVRSVEESEKRRARRLRRRREKEQKKASNDADDGTTSTKKRTKGLLDDDDDDDETKEKEKENDVVVVVNDPESIRASDEFEFLGHVRASHKVKGFVFTEIHRNKRRLQMVVSLATNALEVHSVRKRVDKDTGAVTLETSRVSTLDQYGHPTGVRCVCLSRADPSRAATVSRGMLKVWSVPSRACLRSLPLLYDQPNSETSAPVYALCCAFFGDRVAVGTREGHLLVLDVDAGEVVAAEERAHEGAVWALDVRDDGAAAVTGGADGTVVFWNLDDEGPTRARALEVGEDVVALRYGRRSGEKRLVFVATLDCNVRVFFEDSCRLFLNLYGHKLPVLGLDCSDDDAILASGGADKTIKIWGLDFGDVHRTLYGHSDSITDVRFVRRTHNFFSCGRDKTVRYWDGDRFDCVLVLRGHTSEVNSLAVADSGAFVLSAGMDRQIRVWERTKDMVFVSEERERALERELDRADGARGETKLSTRVRGEDDDDDDDEEKPQSEAAVRRSVLSVAGGDRIMEAIELADKELKERRQNAAKTTNKTSSTAPNPLLLGKDPPQYVLWVLRTIKSAELEQSLLVVPLHHMERLMYYLILILRKGMGVEICAKVAIFLVKTHENQIIAAQRLSTPLRELRRLIKDRLTECRDTIGYNLVAMKTVGRLVREKKNSFLVDEIDYDKNVWGNLGLGSDVAAALEGRDKKRTKR